MPRRLWMSGMLLALVATAGWGQSTSLEGARGFVQLMGGSLIMPGRTFAALSASAGASAYGWTMTVGYSALYAQTALILGLRGAQPSLKPFLAIPMDRYYLAQSGFTVPVGTASMAAGFGAMYGLCRAFGADPASGPLWAAFSTAAVMPTLVTMFLPETIGGLVAERPTEFMPAWLNNWRQIVGLGWSVGLSVLAAHHVGGLGWFPAALAGTVGIGVMGGIMIVFLR